MASVAQGILMALTVTVNKFASSNVQAVQRKGRTSSTSTSTTTTTTELRRRGLLLSTVVAAAHQDTESRTQLLQKYLQKSEENKAKNDKERLDSYNKRNYKDYFEFAEGSLRAKKGELLTESEKGILEWLQTNRD